MEKGDNEKSGGVRAKISPTLFQRTGLDGNKSPHCSGGFEHSEVILEIIQFNFQRANIDSLSCKHLILSEQLIPGDERTKY